MEMNRRQLVIATVTAAACGCLCDAADVFAAPATGPAAKPQAGGIDVGEIKDYPGDGAFDKFAKDHKLIVVRSGDKIYATSAICTHKKCILGGRPSGMACKCHNSNFSLAGEPKGGPAKQPLPRFGIALRDGRIFVDPKKTIPKAKYDAEGSFVKVT